MVSADFPVTVTLDVGGTSVKSGVIGRDGRLDGVVITPIDAGAGADAILDGLAAIVDAHLATLPPEVVPPLAVAFPGPFDYDHGIPHLVHKYQALAGEPLGPRLTARLGRAVASIRFVNDAAAAGAGIVRSLGTDRPDRVLVITLGTGMGSSLFDRDRLIEQAAGRIVSELWMLPHRATTADEAFSATGLARLLGVPPDGLPAAVASAATDHGIEAALGRWGRELGSFLSPLVADLDVGLVMLGGGASAAFDRFAPDLAGALAPVEVRRADDSAEAPLLGAAALTWS